MSTAYNSFSPTADNVRELYLPSFGGNGSANAVMNTDGFAIAIGPNSWLGDVRVIPANNPNGFMIGVGAPYFGYMKGPITIVPRFTTTATVGWPLHVLVYPNCPPTVIPTKRAPLQKNVTILSNVSTFNNPYDPGAPPNHCMISGRKVVRFSMYNGTGSPVTIKYQWLNYGWGLAGANATQTVSTAEATTDSCLATDFIMRQFLPGASSFLCAGGDELVVSGYSTTSSILNFEAED